MEYRSKSEFLGIPVLHISKGRIENGKYKVGLAYGWIAIGDLAFGLLFSAGGLAMGGITLGGLGLGIISFAGASFGVFAMGGMAIGIWAVGGLAVSLHASLGGTAISAKYAAGGLAVAKHANDSVAKEFFFGGFAKEIPNMIRQYYYMAAFYLIPIYLMRLAWTKKAPKRSTSFERFPSQGPKE